MIAKPFRQGTPRFDPAPPRMSTHVRVLQSNNLAVNGGAKPDQCEAEQKWTQAIKLGDRWAPLSRRSAVVSERIRKFSRASCDRGSGTQALAFLGPPDIPKV